MHLLHLPRSTSRPPSKPFRPWQATTPFHPALGRPDPLRPPVPSLPVGRPFGVVCRSGRPWRSARHGPGSAPTLLMGGSFFKTNTSSTIPMLGERKKQNPLERAFQLLNVAREFKSRNVPTFSHLQVLPLIDLQKALQRSRSDNEKPGHRRSSSKRNAIGGRHLEHLMVNTGGPANHLPWGWSIGTRLSRVPLVDHPWDQAWSIGKMEGEARKAKWPPAASR